MLILYLSADDYSEEDAYSRKEDAYSREEDAYSREEDAYSREEDAYSREEDAYSREELDEFDMEQICKYTVVLKSRYKFTLNT